jgi:hypothetical protein
MSATNPHTESFTASTTATGVDTDASGDAEVTVGDLRAIEHAADVDASAAGGYVANVQSVDGNTVTVRIFQGGGADAELSAVTGTNGVTDVHVRAEGY